MQSFGFDTFVSILLPGVFVSVAAFMLLRQFYPETEFFLWLLQIESRDIIVTAVMLTFSTFFGAILGSIQDFFEWKHLDARACKKLAISRDEYNNQWQRYISALPQVDNPYIRSKAQLFRFEIRTAMALICLAIALGLSPGYVNAAIVVGFMAIGIYYLATETHYMLAYWRDSEFASEDIEIEISEPSAAEA